MDFTGPLFNVKLQSYMKMMITLRLFPSPEQTLRLEQLRLRFSEVCNYLAPIIQQTHCWNRVAIHHLTYRSLRGEFPEIGSQMVCNAIYSVCRTARILFQTPSSPWLVHRKGERRLPLIKFNSNAPVYFDRHTLNFCRGKLSLFTLNGRIEFDVNLSEENAKRLREEKLREIILSKDLDGFFLSFLLGEKQIKPFSNDTEIYLEVIDSE